MVTELWSGWYATLPGRENEALFTDLGYNDEVRIQDTDRKKRYVDYRVFIAHRDYLLVKKPGREATYLIHWHQVTHYRRRLKYDAS
jgi:hypothetical protein